RRHGRSPARTHVPRSTLRPALRRSRRGAPHGRRPQSPEGLQGPGAVVVDETSSIASRLFAAIEQGDLEAVRDLYSPDVQIWHNVTDRAQTRDENLKLLKYFTARVAERRYEIHARDFFPGGFVQRHTL